MRRIVLLVIAAVLFASAPVLWAGTYKAAQEMGDLLSVPVTIAASAISIAARSVSPPAYLVPPYISEHSDPAVPICPLPLDRIEFS